MPQRSLTCLEFVETLSAWHDGELDESDERRFDAHRAGCGPCSYYARSFLRTIVIMKIELRGEDVRPRLPEETAQAILAACREAN